MSGRLVDRLAQRVDDLVQVLLLTDQRRRQRHRVAREAQQQTLVEAAVEDILSARAGHVATGRGKFHGTHQSNVADVDHVRQALQGVHLLLPVRSQRGGILKQLLLLEDIQGSDTSGHRQRVTTVGDQISHR